MNRKIRTLMLALVAVSLACGGGGGGSGDPTGGNGLAATFTPEEPAPSADTVSMGMQGASANVVTIAVNVTDTSNVYGALFDLTYPANLAQYVSHSAGTALETGGQPVNYIVDQPVNGRLVISASRLGAVAGANVVGTRPLIKLTFRAVQAGNGSLGFENMAAVNDQLQDLPIQLWAGGTFGAN